MLASDKTQVGIITFDRGPPCDDPSIPRIYERVSAHGSFIQASICMMSSEPPKYCDYSSQLQARIAPLSPSLVPSAAPTHISQAPSYGFQAESLLPTVPLGENTPSAEPSISPAPSIISLVPTTETRSPVANAASPTASPSNEGGIPPILLRPTVGSPTATQTSPPTIPPDSPTGAPSAVPTNPPGVPTGAPSIQSTNIPGSLTGAPSGPLTNSPGLPTELPTQQPTTLQSTVPPGSPTGAPASATGIPNVAPTGTLLPTASAAPTFEATTFFPTAEATTQLPSPSPTSIPTFSNAPSVTPSLFSSSSKKVKSKKSKGTKSNKGSKGNKQSKSIKAGEGKGKGSSGGKGKGGNARKSLKGSGTRGDTFVVVSDQELLEIAMRLFAHQTSSSSSTSKRSAKTKSTKTRTVSNDTKPRPTISTSENMFLRHPLQQN